MKSLLLLAFVVSFLQDEVSQKPPTPLELSRETLERWESEMSEEAFQFDRPSYLWAWIDFDPDKAIELARKEPFRQDAYYCILEPLIARRDWQRVATLTEILDPATLNDRLWAVAAEVAGNHRDEAGLDFIEQQVDRFEKLARAKADQNEPTFTTARLCLAAARLELARTKPKESKEPKAAVKTDAAQANLQYVVTTGFGFGNANSAPEKQIRDLRIAVVHQANEPNSQSWWASWDGFPYDDFLALESWLPGHMGGHYDRNRKDDLSLPLLKLAPDFSWMSANLPSVDSPVVRPWIGRQLMRGRYRLPVAYLARCGASDSVRAGLLAEIAGELPKDENELAMSYLRTATQLLSAGDDDSDQDRMLAAANLSAASHALGLKAASRSWSRKALRILETTDLELTMHVQQREISGPLYVESLNTALMFVDDPEAAAKLQKQQMDDYNNWANRLMTAQPAKPTIGYELLKAVAVSAALNKMKRDSLPGTLIEWIDAQSQSGTKTSWKLPVAGLGQPRDIELVSLTDPTQMRTGHVPEDHAKYNRLKSTKQWAAAADHLQNLAEGNPAWRGSYFNIAAGSVSEMGLQQTLEWMSKIQDTATRMRFEVHAIRAAGQGSELLRLPRLEGKPTSILPGLRLSGLWGC